MITVGEPTRQRIGLVRGGGGEGNVGQSLRVLFRETKGRGRVDGLAVAGVGDFGCPGVSPGRSHLVPGPSWLGLGHGGLEFEGPRKEVVGVWTLDWLLFI